MASPFRLIGRHGLLIFASGTVLALVCQAVMMARPEAAWMPWVLPAVGTAALYGIAWTAETSRRVLTAPAAPAERNSVQDNARFAAPAAEPRL